MNNYVYIFLVMVILISSCKNTVYNNTSQWRGPNRDGIYPGNGLLKEWPENGPGLLWSNEELGFGHGSVAVANGKVYVTGIPDTINSQGTLFTFNLDGELLWEKAYGPDWTENFHGVRSTPTVIGQHVYIESGCSKLYCLNSENGDEVWSVDYIKELGADSIQFGNSESVLIDGDMIFCVPGGKENNVVALNRFTGEKIWSSPGVGEIATYNSPIVFNHNGRKVVVAMSAFSIMAFDASNGEMLWRKYQFQDNKIHANTPLYFNGNLLVCSASRRDSSGLVLFRLNDDGSEATEVWRNGRFINLSGGQVYKDGYIYSSTYLKNDWQVIDASTGEMVQQNKDFGGGAVIYADGLFYGYAERAGEIGLLEASPGGIKLISKFEVPLGAKEHWAHPVINDGRLYIRHGNALMVYNIKEGEG